MTECKQTESQSVLDHGISVWSYTKRIIDKDLVGFNVPTWLIDNYNEILENLHDITTIKMYNIFHDCGKPYCMSVGDDGKSHFPNHTQASKETWLKLEDNINIANLIGWDMVLHTETADEIKAYNFSKGDAYTLLVTALAELHSNAEMFGGIENISFKMKWKTLNRRGKMIMRGEGIS